MTALTAGLPVIGKLTAVWDYTPQLVTGSAYVDVALMLCVSAGFFVLIAFVVRRVVRVAMQGSQRVNSVLPLVAMTAGHLAGVLAGCQLVAAVCR